MANRRPVVPRTSGAGGNDRADSTDTSDATRSTGSTGSRFGARRTTSDAEAAPTGQKSRSTPFSSRSSGPSGSSTTASTSTDRGRTSKASKASEASKASTPSGSAGTASTGRPSTRPAESASARTRTARLRLVHLDPWSVMKTAFLLSIAIGIIAIVAVTIIWGVLGAAGVWDSINSSVQKTVGSDTSKPFDITDYIGTSRVVGFTMIASVIDVVVLTALATLGAFVYNLAATLLGGIEMTLAEDR